MEEMEKSVTLSPTEEKINKTVLHTGAFFSGYELPPAPPPRLSPHAS